MNQTLARMKQLNIPENIEWELIVVNNNCTDGSDHVIANYSDELPIRRVFEPTPGLSNARNAAVREAEGDYILWTDDDVLVDECWLEAYGRAFERCPDVVIFGGPIYPLFERKPPKWLEKVWEKIAIAYAVRDLGPDSIPIDEMRVPFGANYALSLPFQKRYRYDPALGRKGKGLLGGEEETLIIAMLRDGLQGVWVPEAKVSHFIPGSRLNTRYLRRYFRGHGLFSSRGEEPSSAVKLFGHPRWLLRKALQAEMKYRIRRLLCSPVLWIEDLIQASILWGRLQVLPYELPRIDGRSDLADARKDWQS